MRNGSRNPPIGGCGGAVIVTRSVIVPSPAMFEEEVFDEGRSREQEQRDQEQAEQAHASHHSATIYHRAIHHSLISFFGLPLPYRLVNSFLAFADIDGPFALDEGQHSPYLRLGQYAVERRHVALITFRGERRLDA